MWFRKVGVYAAMVSAIALLPSLAFAHATPVSYVPAASATELAVPSSISIRFTERIEVGASSLTVYAPDGAEVNEGKGVLDPADERVLSVPIRDSGEGVYTVSWQVVSVDDGHFTKGAYSFLVDATGKAYEGGDAGVEITYSSKLPEAALSFLNLIGESLFLAVLLCAAFVMPSVRKKMPQLADAGSVFLRACVHLVSVGYLLFVAGGLLSIMHKSAELGALQKITVFEAITTYAGSSAGTYAILKLLAATVFLAVFLSIRKKLPVFPTWAVALLGATLGTILYMQSHISHAAASLILPKFSIFVTFVHLAAKELVIGSIVVLFIFFVLSLRQRSLGLFSGIALRLDVFIAGALCFASVSGAYITWLHLKHGINIATTEWGERFLVLLVLTALFGVFRLLHQCITVPRLAQTRVQRLMLFSLLVETGIALAVLFFSGYISMTTPPFTVAQYDYAKEYTSEGVRIQMGVHPYEEGSMLITLTDAHTHAPIEPTSVIVSAHNEEKDIGPNVLPLAQRFEGGYVFPLADLVPAGQWELSVNAGQQNGYDAHAMFALNYPQDIEASAWSDTVRVFDELAVWTIAAGIGMLVFFCALFAYSSRQWDKASYAPITASPVAASQFIAAAVGAVACMLALFFLWQLVGVSSFQKQCIADGFAWRQAFPTREFDATSQNAVVGCTVHEGHYHFVDQREYRFFMKSQHE